MGAMAFLTPVLNVFTLLSNTALPAGNLLLGNIIKFLGVLNM